MDSANKKPKIAVVIPARYGSGRLPGKPLVNIAGYTMIERLWKIATTVKGVESVYIATDDERIRSAVEGFGGRAIMTSPDCQNGTERVYDCLQKIDSDLDAVVNLQGDAVLTPPWIVEAVVEGLSTSKSDIVTPAVQVSEKDFLELSKKKAAGSSSGTLVVFDKSFKALYFSNALIPSYRKLPDDLSDLHVYRHIGIYGYSLSALEQYLSYPPSALEQAEGLEQLRAMENGMSIEVVLVSYQGRTPGSVDNPEDVRQVEEIIAREGELVP